MKRLWILTLFVVLPMCLLAQQKTEYNRKGDEAMKRLDYSDARMWYEEGVVQCDPYSIGQLTSIWLANQRMRPSMHSLMNKCRACLELMANNKDTTAISQLIVYYTEGIGASKNETLAKSWQDRLETLRKPVEPVFYPSANQMKPDKPKEPMKFFVGYAYSIEAPYGLTVGGLKSRLGWFARFKTNLGFKDHDSECRGDGQIVGSVAGGPLIRFTNAKKDFTKAKETKLTEEVVRLLISCDEKEAAQLLADRKAQYEMKKTFGNFTIVRKKSTMLYGAIDSEANERIPCKYRNVGIAENGRAFERKDGLFDIYNADGVLINEGSTYY